MSSNMIVYLMEAITMIVSALVVFGFPALAIIVVKYFKLKERELTLDIESARSAAAAARRRTAGAAPRGGAEQPRSGPCACGWDRQSATPLPSHPGSCFEGPAAPEFSAKRRSDLVGGGGLEPPTYDLRPSL